MSALEILEQQLQLRHSISRTLDNFKKIGRKNLTAAKVRSRISSLKALWHQMRQGHASLATVVSADLKSSHPYFAGSVLDEVEEAYQDALDYMSECLEELEPPVSLANSTEVSFARATPSAFSLQHLPPIKLPPFDGKFEDWEQFRDRFQSLISENKELSNFARMHFLTSCLKGRALECIAGLAITGDNFEIAWKTLTSRFESTRRLLNVHLSSLMNLTSLSRESASDLQSLRDKVNVAISALLNLNRSPAELWNDVLVYIVVQKLDPITRKAWTVKSSDNDDPPKFDNLDKFLLARARALEECNPTKPSSKSSSEKKITAATASKPAQAVCPICNARHFFYACPTFTAGSPSQRRELVKKHKRCYNCLSQSHSVGECKSQYSCRTCQQRHHSLLHVVSDSRAEAPKSAHIVNDTSSATPLSQPVASDCTVQSLCASTKTVRSQVLLATAWVTVGAASGRSFVVRALLDQGSEMTFVSERLAQNLRTKRINMSVSVSAVGGVSAGRLKKAVLISISPRDSTAPSFSTTALIMPHLTSYAPRQVIDLHSLEHLATVAWADSNPGSSEAIDVILGADVYGCVILDGIRRGGSGEPIAQNSIFGWVISGPVDRVSSSMISSARSAATAHTSISTHHVSVSPSLEDEIRRFWEVEEVPLKSVLTHDELKCESHFTRTHSRTSEGRYVVRLPFKTEPPIDIGETRFIAKRQMESIARKIHTNAELFKEYSEFLREYESLGHMRLHTSVNQNNDRVYIPHHPVFRESSATSRLRVVFNASSRSANGTSLNDHLLAGPKLQTELPSVILKWRAFRFVYTADIAKMFRQIRVDPRDTQYQWIVWKPSVREALVEFELLTITYGMICSPFLALRALKQLASDEGVHFPRARSILDENIYVDDVLFGHHDVAELRRVRDDLNGLLRRGGFELRKWASNSADLLEDIDPRNHGLACTKQLAPDESLKILGIGWNPSLDVFQISVSVAEQVPSTKRAILSAIARLYDPLGWIVPATITAKIFMQQLWKARVEWDDDIPETLSGRWKSIYAQLHLLRNLRLERWISLADSVRAEIHGFSDASNVAYAAAVYIRVISSAGDVKVSLLAAKSRVAPLTPLTVPRLELSAAVLLSRLIEFVRESMNIEVSSYTCWTDSTIVLAWLSRHPSHWKTFVANRVAEIKSRVPNVDWRYVSTHDNPADCASRGLLSGELVDHGLWWRGPPWLIKSVDEWPSYEGSLEQGANLEEKRVILQVSEEPQPFDIALRFSSWPRLIRVTAYIYRFIALCSKHKPDTMRRGSGTALSASECSAARFYWLRQIQTALFVSEISLLRSNRDLPSKSAILALRPFLDGDGILRVGGRLSRAPSPRTVRHPILLASHPLVDLIVNNAHRRGLHSGLQLTLSLLRQDFWILRARSVARSVLFKCVNCTRERAAIPSQLMGDLPAVRVSAPTRCFQHCGLDYAGPILVRASPGRGVASRKAYVALFVCLATRAIHLELVSDYSSATFLGAFTRFCSRRGLPSSVYSDNGTTFVGADRELTAAYRSAVRNANFQNRVAKDRIDWHFLPPSAPHFGGLWEAGVKSVKHHLRRVVGNQTLTFEELTTLLANIEACLNSRPITPLSDSFDEYECLTPGHFLVGAPLTLHPEPSVLTLNENRLSRWQRVRQLTERFWKLWTTDYVNTLQQRQKWRRANQSVKPGQVVLLRNPLLPPCKWEMGRITLCHPGEDGLVRVVTVKTAKSEFKRPITKICVLPVD